MSDWQQNKWKISNMSINNVFCDLLDLTVCFNSLSNVNTHAHIRYSSADDNNPGVN